MMVMSQQEIWRLNKRAIADYVPRGKDLKLIWQIDPPKTDKIIKMYEPLRQLATEQTISYSFVSGDAFGGESKFYMLDIPSQNITEFQERVRNLPDFLEPTAKPTLPPPPADFWRVDFHVLVRCNNAISAAPSRSAMGRLMVIYNYGIFTGGVLCANSIFRRSRSLGWLSIAIMPILSRQHRRQRVV